MSSQDQQRMLEFELTGADVSTNSKYGTEAFQHSLLEPFSSARGVHGIRLQGFRNVAEAKEPFSSLLSPAPHPAACIAKGKKLFDAGNLALKSDPNTGPKLAIRAYEKAIKNLLIDYESDICELPARRVFDSYNVSVIVGHRLELRTDLKKYLALHMMFAYLILYDWESAFIWGKRTIALARTGSHEDRARVQAGQSKIWSRPLYRTPVCYEMAFVAHLLGNRVEEVKLLQGVSRFVKGHRLTCDNIKRSWPGESSAPGIREAAFGATVWEKICWKEATGLDALGGGSG
ncbi:hypothetical protein OEA41_001003 [Lepraria neglecta]|uniref:Uncharacterized protein n=1 Tax=Lepraria neglecta TaxID=209136 RepID=A0AAD9ZI66_9LECA|nr:hypothetical protein OEA41_001003 [Lepraria neglecta]